MQGIAFIAEEQAERLRGAQLLPGDVLLNITGDGITFGRSCIIPEHILPACVNQHVAIVRANREIVEPAWILAFLTHPDVKPYIESFNAGGSRRAITKGHIESFLVPVPPLDEQRARVHILGALDDKIDLNRRMNETLETMAGSLFKSWFIDFDPVRAKIAGRAPTGMDAATAALFPDSLDSSSTKAIPRGWELAPLGDILELKRGYDLPSTDRIAGEVPIISSSGPSGHHNEAKVHGPGVITGRYGTIGKVFLVWEDFWPLNTALYIRDFKGSNFLFAYYLLRSLDFAKFSDKAAVPGINRNHVHMEPVCTAPTPLQCRFGEVIQPWLSLARRNRAQSDTLAGLRDLLLPMLLSGELGIRDAEREVEKVA